jgi:hypothetical protein
VTVFFSLPVVSSFFFDKDDDWLLGICAKSQNETLSQRLADAESLNVTYSNTTFGAQLYMYIDDVASAPIYLYNTKPMNFSACADNRTTEKILPKGDACDAEPFQAIAGLDAYPKLGWYGRDTRLWREGDRHTFEFGSLENCITAKYILTASGPKCGLFGLKLFCPFVWLYRWSRGIPY